MSELPKAYEAKVVDSKWYEFWLAHQFFKADPSSAKPAYCIVMPPPNVTGAIHMGHALVNTLQDVLIRWKRMLGFEVLWVPGTDHAGIATQTVVERHLMQQTGKRRKEFPREEFLEHVWKWKEEKQDRIINQVKKLGCSCDWSRLRFTMDEQNNRAVRAMFKKMYDQGLIYRGDYLVNWDPVTQTALADDEVEYEDQNAFLWHFKYPLKDGTGHVQIATTRPETMLGDTAIAVSPKDPRYTHLIGKYAVQPISGRDLPIIADPFVDPEFGTGAVKITPAHDPNDYQMGLNHKLPFVNIMTPDGKINENGGVYAGMTFEEGRAAVVKEMEKKGLLVKTEPHVNRIGVSYRSKAVIQPYMSKQWFVKMDQFGKKLQQAVEQKKVAIIPQNWENTYFHWVNNLRDWCISRQLWWGHRIPIWYNKSNPEQMICWDGEKTPPEVAKNPSEWVQDEDVLDTWFSSALWPFSTLGWPEKTPDMAKFYPNSVLVTGHDILFFWVARMILMGEYATDAVPYPDVFLHGLIYGKSYWRENPKGGITYLTDKERIDYDLGKPIPKDVFSKWEKMSKSKGNVIDPLEIIEDYGTDAMRMALMASPIQSREIDLDRRRFEEFRNFTNKVWNGARFIFMNLDSEPGLTSQEFSQGLDESLLALEDRWILSALNRTVKDVNKKLESYNFDQAAQEAYDFYWKEFCAFYLEIAKPVLFGKVGTPQERKNKQKLLAILLCQTMRLLHPMVPFITEELFQLLKKRLPGVQEVAGVDPYTAEAVKAFKSDACIVAPYPKVVRESDCNTEIDTAFALVEKVIYAIRNIRGEMKIPPSTATDVYILGSTGEANFQALKQNSNIISALVRTSKLEMVTDNPHAGFASTAMCEGLKIIIPLPEEMLKQEKTRLQKEQERLSVSLDKIKTQLANTDFVSRAPAQLLEKQRSLLEQTERELSEVTGKLASF